MGRWAREQRAGGARLGERGRGEHRPRLCGGGPSRGARAARGRRGGGRAALRHDEPARAVHSGADARPNRTSRGRRRAGRLRDARVGSGGRPGRVAVGSGREHAEDAPMPADAHGKGPGGRSRGGAAGDARASRAGLLPAWAAIHVAGARGGLDAGPVPRREGMDVGAPRRPGRGKGVHALGQLDPGADALLGERATPAEGAGA